MRMLGTIEGQAMAEHFVAYLLTQQISAHVEPTASKLDHWDVWIRDENRIHEAKSEFLRFLADPSNPVYGDAVKEAQEILREQRKTREAAAKRIHRGAQNFTPPMPKLTVVLIVLSVIVSLVTDFMDAQRGNGWGATMMSQLTFVKRESGKSIQEIDPLTNLRKGEVWRTVTPIFLHGNPIHLLFNMMMLVQLGRIIEWREGTTRYGLIVLAIAIFSNCLQGCVPLEPMGVKWLGGSPFFGGMSGVVYGLFGYLWTKSTLRPELLPQISQPFVIIMLVWMLAGFAGILGPIANLAHFGGLVIGMLLGWLLQGMGAKR